MQRNVERDRSTDAGLLAEGWTVLRFWEHENPADVVHTIVTSLTDDAR